MLIILASGMVHSRDLHYLLMLPSSMYQLYVQSASFNSSAIAAPALHVAFLNHTMPINKHLLLSPKLTKFLYFTLLVLSNQTNLDNMLILEAMSEQGDRLY